jgi:hypothetical protein
LVVFGFAPDANLSEVQPFYAAALFQFRNLIWTGVMPPLNSSTSVTRFPTSEVSKMAFIWLMLHGPQMKNEEFAGEY